MDKQTNKQADKHTGIYKGGHIDRQTNGHTDGRPYIKNIKNVFYSLFSVLLIISLHF